MSDLLEIALRVHTERKRSARENSHSKSRFPRWGRLVLVLDTETSTDSAQRLTFGSARLCKWRSDGGLECVREYLFHADDLQKFDPAGLYVLQDYFRRLREPHKCELLSRREFVENVLWIAFKSEVLIIGFNLPFDISRLAIHWTEARGRFAKGFSFILWDSADKVTRKRFENRFRPRVRIKHIDSKRALIDATRSGKDRIRVEFLDLRTLSFALTDQSYSLNSACQAFSVTQAKQAAKQHGHIDEGYIAYNRRDVVATQELLEKLRQEYERHPIELSPVNALSPASIYKAHLKSMGVTPPSRNFRKTPIAALAASMMAYYGGRAECRNRKVVRPVVLCNFLSMYPTINTLMDLWRILIAASLNFVDATEEVQGFLENVTFDQCFNCSTWENFNFIAFVEPKDDILPVRAPYADGSRAFNIAVNPLTCPFPVPFAGPDLVAAKILSGRTPRVTKAWRLLPLGMQDGLRPIKLRGEVSIDPTSDDFFRKIIEQRKANGERRVAAGERARLTHFLKILANCGYGIYAQLDRIGTSDGKEEEVNVYGLDGPFIASTKAVERPGEFYFPPLAAWITAGARLMLAVLERCVTNQGGDYAFCDTDSMAIALTFEKVQEIVKRFEALNPYDRSVVPGSILKIEDENFDPETGRPRQLFCYAIAAKRYVLFNQDKGGQIRIRKFTEHGLGHLMNPIDPTEESRDWIRQLWERIVCPKPDRPDWMKKPAVSRIGATTPELVRRLQNPLKPQGYGEQIKPMGFLLAGHVAPLQVPDATHRSRFQLIAPFEPNPRRWASMIWTDYYSGKDYAITTEGSSSGSIVRVNSYGDVFDAFRNHPEPKSLSSNGSPCGPATIGKLSRRPVFGMHPIYIGKESNRLEEVEQSTIHDWDEVRSEYSDPRADPWRTIVVPVLQTMNRSEIARLSGITKRHVIRLLNLEQMPAPELLERLNVIAGDCARRCVGDESKMSDLAACTTYLRLHGYLVPKKACYETSHTHLPT